MKYKETDMEIALAEIEFYDEDVLDDIELSRLQYFAEHPELADPLIWFLY